MRNFKPIGAATLLLAWSLSAASPQHPNILFIIMDDVGTDQLHSFGYGGLTPPPTPNLDTIAAGGIRFRNVWAMPECSPSRAMFFEGRYPLRTNVLSPILSTDLANSQVSPFETTTPKVLRQAGYVSGLFGKFHMAGPDNNPFGSGTPNSLGFDYFYGFLEGAPHPIDTTAGGIVVTGTGKLPTGPYSCGFVPTKAQDPANGADTGACYLPSGSCTAMSTTSSPTPGRTCLEQGGVFMPNASCQATPPANVNFNLTNAYYVWPVVINQLSTNAVASLPLTDPRARVYSPTGITTAAIDWIQSQGSQPWMATVAYSSIHSPYQQAPQSLTPGDADVSDASCTSLEGQRTLSNQMVHAMDTEIGRLLTGIGLASQNSDGSLTYNPSASNTMLVIIGDNGTYAPSVKAPFDPTRAKGFVYQTGVWVPLIVAGPLVDSPNRDVENMVNVADLFRLFGEFAGLNVREFVPPSRQLDAVSMLPYLTNPQQPSLRAYNFTQTAPNISSGTRGACVITAVNTCTQLFPQQALCESEGGVWYGATATSPGYSTCCALKQAMPQLNFSIVPLSQSAIRNDKYKLVESQVEVCSSPSSSPVTQLELYQVNEATPAPKIDTANANLITSQTSPTQGLSSEQAINFLTLQQQLSNILNSEPPCPGDGNTDGVVNQADISNWMAFASSGSSWYDFNYDGVTDNADLQVIQSNLGKTCPRR